MDASSNLLFSLSFFTLTSKAHADIIIGYRGKGGAFDVQAFNEYARKKNLKPYILYSFDYKNTERLIQMDNRYHFYGYSMGASSINAMMRLIERKKLPYPRRIIAVGAYRTVNVNYKRYGVPFVNYYDNSGRGPGKYINVPHNLIMREVNKYE